MFKDQLNNNLNNNNAIKLQDIGSYKKGSKI